MQMRASLLALPVAAALLAAPLISSAQYSQKNLVSDGAAPAAWLDPNLVNPWGIAFSPSGPFWIADNGTGLSTLYNDDGAIIRLVVTIPPPGGGSPPSAPNGTVFNPTKDFQVGPSAPAAFIFSTEDGTISGWNFGVNSTNAILMIDNSSSGTVYKGLALGLVGRKHYLYATDFHNNKIDVFDTKWAPQNWAGAFTDPNLPSGYAPFNIAYLRGKLFVTYALQDPPANHDDLSGPGHGYIDVYSTTGVLLQRLASGGELNSPWGLAIAPGNFGVFSHALLVGNFGNGWINAFDPVTGNYLGWMDDLSGRPIAITGLWGLAFGNGAGAGPTNHLFFTAGIGGPPGSGQGPETHGLFGSLQLP